MPTLNSTGDLAWELRSMSGTVVASSEDGSTGDVKGARIMRVFVDGGSWIDVELFARGDGGPGIRGSDCLEILPEAANSVTLRSRSR